MSSSSHGLLSTRQIHRDSRRAPAALSGLLQRRCSCGNHAAGQTECSECSRKQQDWQRSAVSSREDAASRISVRPSHNGAEDDLADESVNLNLSAPTRRPPQPQRAVTCPSRTRVDEVTDLTTAGLQAGYLSAYGIVARMRVEPDRVSWDGKNVTEALIQTSSNCPAGLTQPGPCAGNSTFTIGGASGNSGVIPQQPAMRNRFYDFHTTRSRQLSFLHSAARNPGGLSACEAVCQQTYSCDGVPIGTHTITRRFRKGTFNGANVTIIDVTKEDNPAGPGDFPLPPADRPAYAGTEPTPEEVA